MLSALEVMGKARDKRTEIVFLMLFLVSLILVVAYRILKGGYLQRLQQGILCSATGLPMYCDPAKHQLASNVSNELGVPYEDEGNVPSDFPLKIRSIVQRYYEAINKPAFQELSQLADEICPLYMEMLELEDEELRQVAELYRRSYSKTIRKELGETFFQCDAGNDLLSLMSPAYALYSLFNGNKDKGQLLIERLNELNIP